ncbi:DUF3352 domain-containing protein [Geitlerinema sp. P-1104]|uniref:DUF3352 domain-containing protein n=1 Tax=Geitlerinema sp. P-1104 TaxID=2546230 RepID=UPI0014772D51|nr:DUF3352 domain-containing protein [Geitlerinema sp. P-1104]NMG59182.1 DUF3352 domain-containing protein [Geitlerinema sp. P-1104]
MKHAQESKTSHPLRRPITITATVLLVTGAIAYGWLRLRPTPLQTPLDGAKTVPGDAVMAAYIDMDIAAWDRLRRFGTPEAQAWMETQIAQLQQDLLEATQLDFNRDLRPWIGNVMLALVPQPESQSDSQPEALLAIVGIRDKLQALAFANRVRGTQDQEIEEQTYRNITISTVTLTGRNPQSYSLAILGDYLAIAESADIIKAAIDTNQDGSSLARQDHLQNLLRSQPVDQPLIQTYISNLETLQQLDSQPSPRPISVDPSPTALVMGIGVTDMGLQARTLIHSGEAESTSSPMQPLSQSSLDRFPENTLAVLEGSHLDRSWNQWTDWLEQTSSGRRLLRELRGGVAQLGFDLDRELVAPLNGRVAAGVIPNPGGQGLSAAIGVGAMAFIESSDRATLDNSLSKLGGLVQRGLNLPVRVESSSIQGHSLTEWKLSFFGVDGETLLGYSWLEPDLLALGVTRPMVDLFLTPPQRSLAQNPSFRELQGQFPDGHGGFLFANVEQMRDAFDLVMLQTQELLNPETIILLETVRAIGITASPVQDGISAVEIHIPLVLAE